MLGDRVDPDSCFRAGETALCVACRHKTTADAKGSESNHKDRTSPCFAQAERRQRVHPVTQEQGIGAAGTKLPRFSHTSSGAAAFSR